MDWDELGHLELYNEWFKGLKEALQIQSHGGDNIRLGLLHSIGMAVRSFFIQEAFRYNSFMNVASYLRHDAV